MNECCHYITVYIRIYRLIYNSINNGIRVHTFTLESSTRVGGGSREWRERESETQRFVKSSEL